MPRVTFGQERECAPCASAPGKLLIAGEYAVLEGAPALVAAINRRARAEMRASGEARTEPVSPLHLAIGGTLGSDTSELERLHLDTRALFLGQRKLGLGSSAAACVAGIAALSAPEDWARLAICALEGGASTISRRPWQRFRRCRLHLWRRARLHPRTRIPSLSPSRKACIFKLSRGVSPQAPQA